MSGEGRSRGKQMMYGSLRKKIISSFFLCQGTFGILWWVLLAFAVHSRDYFLPSGFPDTALFGFWLADILFFIVGSMYCGFSLLLQKKTFKPIYFFVAGGISYAFLYCLGISLLTNEAWLSTGLMFLSMILTLYSVYEINESSF